jgi:hypothetical protein
MDSGNSRRWHGGYRFVAATILLILVSGSPVKAQDSTNDDLQGRVLQRSDGALFIYKDGFKYPVVVADIGDDAIDALPDGDASLVGVAQLFPPAPPAPPPPIPDPPAPVIVIMPTPTIVPGPYIAVSNPVAGDNLAVGGLDMQGKAFDPSAASDQGSGIDRVQIFLEDRDRGGLHLADARLGFANPAAAPGSQFSLAGWEAVVNLPSGAHTLFVYARSAVTNKESAIQVPVRVGTGG